MSEATKDRDLQDVGRCALASIREMVAALEVDYDRLEELRDERETWLTTEWDNETEDGEALWAAEFPGEAEEFAELIEAAGECESRDDAQRRIDEDPLSIQVRSGWVDLGDFNAENVQPEEFEILLATGGPAVRIMGELDGNNEPSRAYLQVQDWGTPWTDYYESGVGEACLAYARCFCFDVG